jgi:hypothetical protein
VLARGDESNSEVLAGSVDVIGIVIAIETAPQVIRGVTNLGAPGPGGRETQLLARVLSGSESPGKDVGDVERRGLFELRVAA